MAMARISPRDASPRRLYIVLALLALLVVALGLAALGQVADALPDVVNRPVQQSVVLEPPYWLDGQKTTIRDGLVINPHAKKHNAETLDAWLLYDLLLAQQCAASRRYCQGGSELYLCVTETGQIGGLIVRGSEILSGYVGSDRYWHGKVLDEWSACDGREYR